MSEDQTFSMEPVVNTENAESVDDLTVEEKDSLLIGCLLYTSPSPRDVEESRMAAYA